MQLANRTRLLEKLRELPAAAPLLRRLGDHSSVFLVGGSVRDLLLGGRPSDLDLAVEGEPAAILGALDGDAVVYDRFGTSTVTVDGFTYDIAGTRSETYAHPGALPDVRPASLAQDLRRRDFTVNAIALALGGESRGELHALPGALDDLRARSLRVIHERSFQDDPTRLLRLAKYRGRLGFEIESGTRRLATEAIARDALATVSGPRIGNELRLLAREQDPVAALAALRELELDTAIAPGFGLPEDEQVARRALDLLPEDGRREWLTVGLAAQRIPADELRALLDRLGFEADERAAIVSAATRAAPLAEDLSAAQRPSEIANAALGVAPEAVALAGALGPLAAAAHWLERLRHVQLEIDGSDLLAAGVEQGPAVGRALRAALSAKLDGRTSSSEDELAVALENARTTG